MHFDTFFEHLTPVSPQVEALCARLCDVDLQALEAESITALYPAFHECLGVLHACERPGQRWFNPRFDPEDVLELTRCIEALRMPCLEGKVLYSMSASIMKPRAHIDWHYDMHARSMVCERLHIPVTTNGGVTFYSKWFDDAGCYQYWFLPGSLYRLNNRTPHAVANDSDRYRTHMVFDYIDAGVLDYLRSGGKLGTFQQDLLAPVLPTHAAFRRGRPRGERCGQLRYFKYSAGRVRALADPLPESYNPRNLWLSDDRALAQFLATNAGLDRCMETT